MDVNRVHDSTPFPDDLMPKIRPSFKTMKAVLTPLVVRFFRALALSLGLEREYFVERHRFMIADGNSSKLRALYYPPIKGTVYLLR